MGKLITVIGPSGIGKTSLVNELAKTNQFSIAFEEHADRPFQAMAKQDAKYIFANQMDYLILRAEQEMELRNGSQIGLLDGGLDLDFHGFTRLFLSRNLLSSNEFDLCQRFYLLIRRLQPLPELIVRLKADEETVAGRLSGRKRINIAQADDISIFNFFLDQWLGSIPSSQILEMDVSNEDVNYEYSVDIILDTIEKSFKRRYP